MHSTQNARGWEQARQTIEDLRAARDVPREEFPGHKEIYCSNLEGFLGGRFPLLLAERDELVAEVERLRGVMAVAVEELSRDRGDGTWTGTLTELDELANDAVEAMKAALR